MTLPPARILLLGLLLSLLMTSCTSPPPTCSATDTAYDICSANQIWECPVASDDALAEKQTLIDECDASSDPPSCIAGLEFEMFETELAEDCAAAGQVCSEDPFDGPPECQDRG